MWQSWHPDTADSKQIQLQPHTEEKTAKLAESLGYMHLRAHLFYTYCTMYIYKYTYLCCKINQLIITDEKSHMCCDVHSLLSMAHRHITLSVCWRYREHFAHIMSYKVGLSRDELVNNKPFNII